MKTLKPTMLKGCSALVAAVLSASAISSQAVLVTPATAEIPGAALGAAVPNFGGTFITEITAPFVDVSAPSNFSGSLRSTVVRNAGGTLDFYYQLSNTTTGTNIPDPELYRLTLNPFSAAYSTSGTSYEAFVISNGLTGIAGAPASVNGTVAAFSADRQVGVLGNGFGFDFGDDHFLDDTTAPFTNLNPGQTANFLLVRTRATEFTGTTALAIGAGTSTPIRSFQPIPEPTTILVGLALTSFVGCSELGRSRRRKAVGGKA